MDKHIYISDSSNDIIIIDEEVSQLNITVLPNQSAEIYQQKLTNDVNINIRVDEGATLNFFSYHKLGNLDLTIKADLASNAKLLFYFMNSGTGQMNVAPRLNLKGMGSSIEILSVYLLKGDAHLLCDTYINHEFPSTTSKIVNFAIAKERAKLILNNNTTILNGSRLSNASQTIKGLNLSTDSRIEANPNLFIDEHDVIAHHGAGVGSINKDDLFYLMSRGLTEEEASKMIVMGFIQPLIDQIENDNLKIEIKKDFEEKLK